MNIQWHDTIAAHNATQSVIAALNGAFSPVNNGNDFCVPAWRVGAISDGSILYVCEDDASNDGYDIITLDERGDIEQIASITDCYNADELLRFVRDVYATL